MSRVAASHLLLASEIALFVFGAILVLGLVFEERQVPAIRSRLSSWLKKHAAALVIVGVAGELIADGGVFASSWRLETLAEAEIAASLQQAAGANERASIAERQAAELKKQAEDERLARVKIEQLLAPRQLTDDQQQRIASALKPYAGQRFDFVTFNSDPECVRLTLLIADLLVRAGWQKPEPKFSMLLNVEFGVILGLAPNPDPKAKKAADAFALAFKQEGIAVSFMVPGQDFDPGLIQVRVGKKP